MKLSTTTFSRSDALRRFHLGVSPANYKVLDDFLAGKGVKKILDIRKQPHYTRNDVLALKDEIIAEMKKHSKRPNTVGVPKPDGFRKAKTSPKAATFATMAKVAKAQPAIVPRKAKKRVVRHIANGGGGSMFTVRIQYSRTKHITLSMDESKKLYNTLSKLWGNE